MPAFSAPADQSFQLYDSAAQRLLPLRLPKGAPLSFYACGVTPYAAPHVGHGRSFVVFDALTRTLDAFGWPTTLVRNVTDIDDKIIAAAHAQGANWNTLAWGWADRNRDLLRQVGVRDTPEPKVSEHLDDIRALIVRLLNLGHAYLTPTGDVYFDTTTFQGTDVAHQPAQALRSASGQGRVQHAGKKHPADFALWKAAKPGEPAWPSAWGDGRPGWHIECSAMAQAYFGDTLTIHGGGTDLRFPHHQCEVCQSEAAFGRPLAHHWIHHGSVLNQGEKMSKSLGNVVALDAALAETDALLPGQGGAVLRWALLNRHWAKPLDWQPSMLAQAAQQVTHFGQALQAGLAQAGGLTWLDFLAQTTDVAVTDRDAPHFWRALGTNFNVPGALTILHGATARMEQPGATGVAALRLVGEALEMLGWDASLWPTPWMAPTDTRPAADPEVTGWLEAREAARQRRDFAEADRLRDQIQAKGWTVEDRPAPERPRLVRRGP